MHVFVNGAREPLVVECEEGDDKKTVVVLGRAKAIRRLEVRIVERDGRGAVWASRRSSSSWSAAEDRLKRTTVLGR